MNCKVEKSEISGNIICPSNKSYTHRAIFLASLAIDKSIIKNILRAETAALSAITIVNYHLNLS